MAAPSLKIPLSLDMDSFKKAINDAKSATSEATQFIVKKFIDLNQSALLAGGGIGALAVNLRSILGTIGFIGGGITAIVASFELMSYATELAEEKIKEFNKTAAQAGTAGVSTDFFQRFVQGAQELKLSVSDATDALNKFQQASKDSLGGSQLQQEITKLTTAGNFSDNSGVAAFGASTDTQARLQAIVSLIDQALDSGQRLAGLDIADKAFGSKVADNLAADSGYLDKMLATASGISASKIVSDEQIGQAIELKNQLTAAQQVLSERWKPIQDDLAKLGMNYEASWVGIYTDIAAAVGYADQLYESLKKIPDVLANAGNSPFWTKLTEITGALGLNSTPSGLILAGQPGFSTTDAGSPAFNALRSGLQNPNAVKAAMQKSTQIQFAVQGDTSKAPGSGADDTDAVDRAIDSLNKHVEATQADAKAVGLGAAALAEFKAQAQETAAIQKNGGEETADQAAKFKQLQAAAAAAAQALAVAQVNSNISRGEQTAFLTPEDLAIANQLRSIYGDNIPAALNSSYAAALKFNDAIKDLGQLGQQVNEGFFTDFETQIRNGATAMQALQTAGVNALGAIADKLAKMAADDLWSAAFGGTGNSSGLLGSLLGGLTGANGAAAAAKSASTLATNSGGAFFGPGFASGTDNAPGGLSLVGENGPEILNIPKGGQVIPNDVLKSGLNGGVSAPVNIQIDARNADAAGLANLQVQLNQLQADLPGRIVQTVTKAKKQRLLT